MRRAVDWLPVIRIKPVMDGERDGAKHALEGKRFAGWIFAFNGQLAVITFVTLR